VDIKMFSEAYSAIRELVNDLVALQGLPAEQRKKHLRVVHETLGLLDQAISLVVTRLRDVLHVAAEEGTAAFASQLRRLDNVAEWYQLEREVRLCSSLRSASREMEGIVSKLGNRLTLKNPDQFDMLIRGILEGEGRLADHIGVKLQKLAALSGDAQSSEEGFQRARDEVRSALDVLLNERQALIKTELEVYDLI
jgi:anthranilate phosphoribosyltransferase